MLRVQFLALTALSAFISSARADHFEHYTSPVLQTAVQEGKFVKEYQELTSDQINELGQVLADNNATFLIVKTNDNRWAKLLVQAARQRFGRDGQAPMLLIEKYVTFKESTERTIKAKGENLHLYPGTRLLLDIGQVVPEKLGGDIQVVENDKDKLAFTLKVIGDAKIYVLTKPIPDVVPKKAEKLEIGATFEMRYFNGKYKLHDDGRRSGKLNLEVTESGEVSGVFYSDRDGAKYDVVGKAGNPRHAISFTIKFPQVEQTFTGFMFTGDGKAMAGTSKMQEREAAFYAVRVDE